MRVQNEQFVEREQTRKVQSEPGVFKSVLVLKELLLDVFDEPLVFGHLQAVTFSLQVEEMGMNNKRMELRVELSLAFAKSLP